VFELLKNIICSKWLLVNTFCKGLIHSDVFTYIGKHIYISFQGYFNFHTGVNCPVLKWFKDSLIFTLLYNNLNLQHFYTTSFQAEFDKFSKSSKIIRSVSASFTFSRIHTRRNALWAFTSEMAMWLFCTALFSSILNRNLNIVTPNP